VWQPIASDHEVEAEFDEAVSAGALCESLGHLC
jgi:hypothetical protein